MRETLVAQTMSPNTKEKMANELKLMEFNTQLREQ